MPRLPRPTFKETETADPLPSSPSPSLLLLKGGGGGSGGGWLLLCLRVSNPPLWSVPGQKVRVDMILKQVYPLTNAKGCSMRSKI
jgi:hypothetical protein